jgi:hypothetical protein
VSAEPRRWLLLIYKVPQQPAGRRTHVWRQLRQLGALYLQQAAALLPLQPATRRALDGLLDWIEEIGGEASLLETASPSESWERTMIARFNRARDEEYAEIVENAERFEDEVARETRKGKFTFAELEDLESDWEKLGRWFARVQARDFFATPGVRLAEAELERASAALAAFTAMVAEQEEVADAARTEQRDGIG